MFESGRVQNLSHGKRLTPILLKYLNSESICSGQHISYRKFEICVGKARKHGKNGKRRKWLPAFSPFPMFSKGFYPRVLESRDCDKEHIGNYKSIDSSNAISNIMFFFFAKGITYTRHNSVDSVPTSNLVCIKEVAII